MNKTVFFTGLMLFSLFFGAGNLIFPPYLGMEAGDAFTPAIIGFNLTAVLLPLFTVIAIALSKDGLETVGARVHPLFGLVFAVIVYLAIGPLYVIPRAANVAYELGFVQVTNVETSLALFIFSVFFFLVTYLVSIRPQKMLDIVGRVLTPLLLIVLTLLVVRAFFVYPYEPAAISEKYQAAPFLTGFWEGYFTLDAIAALAFGMVIVRTFQMHGIQEKPAILRGTIGAGAIAAIGLTLVYLSLAWVGRVLPFDQEVDNGAQLLIIAAEQLFGYPGNILFGIIVLLACLTTAIGLITATSQFFVDILPKFSYKTYVRVFTLIGLGITNFGLERILNAATPLLGFLYPVAIVLVALSLFQYKFGESPRMYQYSVSVAILFGVYDAIRSLGWVSNAFHEKLQFIPLIDNGIGWLVPFLFVAAIGYFLDRSQNRVKFSKDISPGAMNQ